MPSAAFILAINLAVAGMFTAALIAVAAADRTKIAPRWFVPGFLAVGLNLAFEYTLASAVPTEWMQLVTFVAFLAALFFINIGLCHLYDHPVPKLLLSGILAGGIVLCLVSQAFPRESLWRLILYQTPDATMQAVGAWVVLSRANKPLDRLFGTVQAASAVQFLSKPFLAAHLGGAGSGPTHFFETDYANASQSLGTVFGVAIALLLLSILVRDLLGTAITNARRDGMSGLLNHTAFNAALADLLGRGRSRPVAFVLCDLDHFKAINDLHGHAIGDRVITDFAALLSEATPASCLVGRLGGEEFAVALPDIGRDDARVYAESLRLALKHARIDGLPASHSVTASFGIAAVPANAGIEPLALTRRADAALYLAKRAGRDQVKSELDVAVAEAPLPPRQALAS
ncbi:GGDEF domain-containing protein [Pararhizobium mangrovi]|nr:GGDEF domain-containing protein [Pararhizobium mangrovi]